MCIEVRHRGIGRCRDVSFIYQAQSVKRVHEMNPVFVFMSIVFGILAISFVRKLIQCYMKLNRLKKLGSEIDATKALIDKMDNAYEEYDYREKERIDKAFPASLTRMKTLVTKLDNPDMKRCFPVETLSHFKSDWKLLSKGLEQRCEMYSMNGVAEDGELKELIDLQRKANDPTYHYVDLSKRIDALSGSLARHLSHTQTEVKIAVNAIIAGNDALDRYQRINMPRIESEFELLKSCIDRAIKPHKKKLIFLSIAIAACFIFCTIFMTGVSASLDSMDEVASPAVVESVVESAVIEKPAAESEPAEREATDQGMKPETEGIKKESSTKRSVNSKRNREESPQEMPEDTTEQRRTGTNNNRQVGEVEFGDLI